MRGQLAVLRQTILVILQTLENSATAWLNVGTELLRIVFAGETYCGKVRIGLRLYQWRGLQNHDRK
jgi:hypothetical protein